MMFPWQSVFSGISGRSAWYAFNSVLTFVSTILAWDVVKYTLAAVSGMVLIGYLVNRVRAMGEN